MTITRIDASKPLCLIGPQPVFRIHNSRIEQALDGFCSLHSVYGRRRSNRYGSDSEDKALSREATLHFNPDHAHYGCLWAREYWATRRSDSNHPLIAWTEDKNGRIVRAWQRHLTPSEFKAYDTDGNRSCPVEAAWIASIRVGLPSLPALPFQMNLDGHEGAAACVRRLIAADLI
jgi:hypothetical protein